jgi:hypothetical protein
MEAKKMIDRRNMRNGVRSKEKATDTTDHSTAILQTTIAIGAAAAAAAAAIEIRISPRLELRLNGPPSCSS